ncbi:hypothetical protein LXL04_002217 [Taraxacum kok-saghyz]
MSRVAGDVDFGGLVSHLLDVNLPDAIGKMIFPSPRSHHESRNGDSEGNIPVDILETPKELILYIDVPGLSKSDIQVTVEEEKLLVVRSNGKRKREENEEEERCKYLRLERRPPRNLMRKFRLSDNCNTSAISAKCENGVLIVTVEKIPPPPKSRTVKVAIS